MPLVLVDHNESNFGLSRLHDDVAAAADDQRLPAFLHHGDQGHVADEVDVREEGDFLLREAALHSEETPVERLGTGAAHGCEEIRPIVQSESANIYMLPIAQQLNCRVHCGVGHDQRCHLELNFPTGKARAFILG